MKLAILSDLHIEGAAYKLDLPPADVCILAGDIVSSHTQAAEPYKRFIGRANEFYGEENVLEIDGNHKGYGGSIEDFTNEQILEIGHGIALIGATLWSGVNSEYAYSCLNDKYIKDFTWQWMYDRHLSDLEFITKALDATKDMKQIVFTHHIPTVEGVHTKWLATGTGGVNYGFYTDLDYLINDYAPEYWIFGHTHDSMHKFHSNGKTQLVCNPRGYRRRDGTYENNDFNPNKVIEI